MPRRDDLDDARPWYAKAGFLVAAAFVAAVLVVGLGLVFAFGPNDEPDPDTSPPPATSTPTPGDSDEATSPPEMSTAAATSPGEGGVAACETPQGSEPQAALTTPPEVEWLPTGEVPAALTERDGPTQREGLLACYSRTSAGALLAAYNFLAQYRTSSNSPVEVVEVLSDEGGPRYEELLEYSRTELDGPDAYGPFDVLGYRFYAYDGDSAEVALVHAIPGTTGTVLALDVVTLRWTGSTWTVWSLTDLESVSEVPAGFVPWGSTAARDE